MLGIVAESPSPDSSVTPGSPASIELKATEPWWHNETFVSGATATCILACIVVPQWIFWPPKRTTREEAEAALLASFGTAESEAWREARKLAARKSAQHKSAERAPSSDLLNTDERTTAAAVRQRRQAQPV